MTLDDILAATSAESQQREDRYPLPMIKRKVEKMGATRGFAHALRKRPFSVIAEIKRQSPSMGKINSEAVAAAHKVYAEHPLVSAISVLTQNHFFGGKIDDLEEVRKVTQNRPKPILRKDFIFSEYEVYFSRWIGADAILLMANVVEDKAVFKTLHDLAVSIGLDVLCEIHDEQEIEILPDTIKICGINSRRFKGVRQRQRSLVWLQETVFGFSTANSDTRTDLNTFSLFDSLANRLPSDCLRIAESGLSADNIGTVLRKYYFDAALIGTSLLKAGISEMPRLLNKIQEDSESAFAFSGKAKGHSEVTYA